jgi:hypothetical protein
MAAYEAVRFNAMKHGILSELAVLAHEDHAEFDDLLAALIEEHRPAGMTERASDRGACHDHLAQAAGIAGRRREDQRGAEKRVEQPEDSDPCGCTFPS